MIYASWFDARQYCEWVGGRLPTDAEWEKAARGTEGNLFLWGNELPNEELVNVNYFVGELTAVNSFEAGISPFGLYNMAGNVWEWTADWWDAAYTLTNTNWTNPAGSSEPRSPPRRVGRGSAWHHSLGIASVALRDWWEPEKSAYGVGFRCAHDSLP